jgi:hypothetical protein
VQLAIIVFCFQIIEVIDRKTVACDRIHQGIRSGSFFKAIIIKRAPDVLDEILLLQFAAFFVEQGKSVHAVPHFSACKDDERS